MVRLREHLLLSKSPRFRVIFHRKKPMTHNTATPPATESPMMVDVEMPPPPPELLLLEVCVGAALVDDGVSETTITLVMTWPFESVVTMAEVIGAVGAVDLAAALVGVELVWAFACVDFCAADAWGVVDEEACCELDELVLVLVLVLEDAAWGVCESAALDAAATDAGAAATWRWSKTFRAGETSIKSLWRARTKVRRPARVTRIPKNCAFKPARMIGREK